MSSQQCEADFTLSLPSLMCWARKDGRHSVCFPLSLELQLTIQNPFVCPFGCRNHFSMRISDLPSATALRSFNEVCLILPLESEALSYRRPGPRP